MRAVLFPGQGSQRRGMGADVFDRFPALVAEADRILGYSVRAQCLQGAEPGLTDTRYVQPALYVVNALMYRRRVAEHGAPDVLAGHSLGEYNALLAAGCLDFGTGLRLVRRRGELMSRANGGGMAAVLGLDLESLRSLLDRAGLTDLDLANHNSADQIVLSGPAAALRAAADAVREAGARCVPLRVSAPFHSRYMAPAAAEFGDLLGTVEFADPAIPVVANVTGRPYGADEVRATLVRQLAEPVLWWESMGWLLARGVREVAEVGPGSTLTKLWQEIQARPPVPVPAASPAASPAGSPAVSSAAAPALSAAAPASLPAAAAAPASPPAAVPSAPWPKPRAAPAFRPELLGSAAFRRDYGVRYAYAAGAMFKGIASAELVIRMGQAGLLGFFGTGGLKHPEIEAALRKIQDAVGPDGPYGMNLLAVPDDPGAERRLVELYLRHDVRHVEAAGFTGITPAVVHFRFSGVHRGADGRARTRRHVIAKASRPEVVTAFMSPPPAALLAALVADGSLTPAEADLAAGLPVAGDVCVEADSGGHTDGGNPVVLIPAMTRLREELTARHGYRDRIRVGAAGGLGSPAAVAAAFVLGAEFVVTGSVNQCSPQAGTSDAVKDLLAELDVQDTAYAPAGDLFEAGSRAQVVRRGTLFPGHANKLYQLYRQFRGLHELDAATRRAIEERYFRRSFDEVWQETGAHLRRNRPRDFERAQSDPKAEMAQVFRWYFIHANRLALAGETADRANFQIHCGPAMGAFNRCVAGTALSSWRERHVDLIAELLMTGAAEHLSARLADVGADAGGAFGQTREGWHV